MKKGTVRRILTAQVPLPLEIVLFLSIILLIEMVLFTIFCEVVAEYCQDWQILLLGVFDIILLLLTITPEPIQRTPHLNIRKIFKGITSSEIISEDEVISRIEMEVQKVISKEGSTYNSIYMDLENLKDIAASKSMGHVEEYLDKKMLKVAIVNFER